VAGLWVPNQRIAQPRSFSRANPKWVQRGLVALFDLNQMVEVLSGARPTSIGGTPKSLGKQGRGVKFAGSGSVVWAHQPQFAVTGPLSILAAIDVASLANYSEIISKEGTTTTYMPYEFRLGQTENAAGFNLTRASASTYQESSNPTSYTPTGFSGAIGITHVQGAGPVNYTLPDQNAVADTTTITLTPADNGAAVYIGSRASGTVFFNGMIYLVALFNKALDPIAAGDLMQDIWDLYAPEMIFVPAGGSLYPTLSNIRFNPATSTGGYFAVDMS
jgi:hypothetical protein